MSGMYPNDRMVEIFGEEIKYPGLDPVTQKFTDGDFNDPLKKPSYIPAETTNLILDNLENLIRHAGLNPNNTDTDQLVKAVRIERLNSQFYPGLEYEQKAGGYTPQELTEMGVFPEDAAWADWHHRAERYELVPIASFTSGVPAEYASGQNVAANAYRIYQLTGDDRQIWKANKAITSLPAQINPKDWDLLPNITRVRRCDLHDVWTDDDLEIGTGVEFNGQQMIVVGILVSGGKYRAAEGGNRGTFNDGTAGDTIRNATGQIDPSFTNVGVGFNTAKFGGVFKIIDSNYVASNVTTTVVNGLRCAALSLDNVVPTGNENQPRTSLVRHWRLVSKAP